MTSPQPPGFLALPASGPGPGVLVLHAWWGLNETMKSVCSRLAAEGFVAFCCIDCLQTFEKAPGKYSVKKKDTPK